MRDIGEPWGPDVKATAQTQASSGRGSKRHPNLPQVPQQSEEKWKPANIVLIRNKKDTISLDDHRHFKIVPRWQGWLGLLRKMFTRAFHDLHSSVTEKVHMSTIFPCT